MFTMLLLYIIVFCWEKISIYCISHTTLSPGPPFSNNNTCADIFTIHKKTTEGEKKDYWTPDVGVEPTALRLKV